MAEIVVRNAVKREYGYLYYVDKEGNVCRSIQARGKKKKEDMPQTAV